MDRLPAASSIQTNTLKSWKEWLCFEQWALSHTHIDTHTRTRRDGHTDGWLRNLSHPWKWVDLDMHGSKQRSDQNNRFLSGCSLESGPFPCIPPGLDKFISKCYIDFWSILRCLVCFWCGRCCRGSHSECQHSGENCRRELPMLLAGS